MSMGASPDRDANAAVAGGTSVTTSLEQIRELLFGHHFRDLERKLARIDAHLVTEAEELRKEMRRRLDVLEAHLQRESEALVGRFESERASQVEAIANTSRESRDTVAALEQRVTKMEEALARAQRELRQQILDQAKAFLDETQRTRDELVTTLERELSATDDEPRERVLRGDAQEQARGH